MTFLSKGHEQFQAFLNQQNKIKPNKTKKTRIINETLTYDYIGHHINILSIIFYFDKRIVACITSNNFRLDAYISSNNCLFTCVQLILKWAFIGTELGDSY